MRPDQPEERGASPAELLAQAGRLSFAAASPAPDAPGWDRRRNRSRRTGQPRDLLRVGVNSTGDHSSGGTPQRQSPECRTSRRRRGICSTAPRPRHGPTRRTDSPLRPARPHPVRPPLTLPHGRRPLPPHGRPAGRRQRADHRRDARHQQRRPRPLPQPRRASTSPGSRPCRTGSSTVVSALRGALAAADLVVTTGGLGPTPDDLTRESIAAVCGEEPAVDPELARWLRHLFERRGVGFAETNLKQAWLIPSATAIPNDRGTAPGWWVDRPDGRVVVALPGPPSEMRPMWQDWVMPRLARARPGPGAGHPNVPPDGNRRVGGGGLLGEGCSAPRTPSWPRTPGPTRWTCGYRPWPGRAATPLSSRTRPRAAVLAAVGDYVWGHGRRHLAGGPGSPAGERRLDVALVEVGTGGSAARLLGEAPWLAATRTLAAGDPRTPGAGRSGGRGPPRRRRFRSGSRSERWRRATTRGSSWPPSARGASRSRARRRFWAAPRGGVAPASRLPPSSTRILREEPETGG